MDAVQRRVYALQAAIDIAKSADQQLSIPELFRLAEIVEGWYLGGKVLYEGVGK